LNTTQVPRDQFARDTAQLGTAPPTRGAAADHDNPQPPAHLEIASSR
jgi:hypothetical protein